MADHGIRDHATWSASSTARNWACAGALALGSVVEKLDVESEAAAWGTACHQLVEFCLRRNCSAAELIGRTEKTKRFSFEVDDEMAETAQMYVDYVTGRCGNSDDDPAPQLWIEERFSLDKLDPPFDAGGTCDAIVYNPAMRILEVIDLKGGRGVRVEVNENKQLRTYALGAMLAHPELSVDRVRVTIVQPRMEHKDGRIRSEEFHVADLAEWTADLRAAMARSDDAWRAFDAVTGELTRETWGETWLKQGDHCTFCPAAGICPALEKKALAVADAFFNDGGQLVVRNQPADLDPARLAAVLDGADTLQNWLNAVRATAMRAAETGTDIPGYHLADKIGHRKFKSDDAAAQLAGLGLSDDDIYAEPRLRSPAQIEKALGAKRLKPIKDQFNALVHKPVTGRSLVSSARSERPAVASSAQQFFGG